jgi:DUF4097 and DUF4098 domain-containing protein YvlB
MRSAIVGLVMLSAGAAGIARGTDTTDFERRMDADPHGVVEISNISGRVEIMGWDKPEIDVRADVGGGTGGIDVSGDREHGHISIKVYGPSFRGLTANLRVKVPRDSEIDVTGASLDISSKDVEGALQLKTVSGGITADVFQKGADVKTVSGDVILRGRGREAGAAGIHVSSIGGNIHVDRAGGDLEATSVSGDMSLRLDHPAHSVRLRTTSGDVSFEGRLTKGANLEAETVSGDLTVRASPEGTLDYEVNTFSGDIRNCMGVESERVSKYGPGRRLNGTRGTPAADEARIRLKTMSGDVELCDRV